MLEDLLRHALGQIHQAEIVANIDTPDMLAVDAGLVGDRADDIARLDTVRAPDLDPEGFQIAVRERGVSARRLVRRGAGGRARWLFLRRVEHQRLVALRQIGEHRRELFEFDIMLRAVFVDQPPERIELRAVQCIGDALLEARDPLLVDFGHAGQIHRLDRLARGALDGLEQPLFAHRHEQDGVALAPGATGPADAMHVRLGVVRNIEIDDVADSLHVQAAGRHVGGHQDIELAVLQARDGALALGLGDIAVERRAGMTARGQPFGKFIGRLLGAREHDHRVERLGLEQPRERVELAGAAADDPVALADVDRGRGLRLNGDFLWRLEMRLRDPPDRRRHGRRKQRHLTFGRRLFENPFDVVDEPHAQHFVGFVEHHPAQVPEPQRAALDVIHHTAGRADHHIDTALERGQLRAIALAAVDRQHGESVHVAGIALEGFRDLDRQLARGRKHERLRALSAATAAQARQNGQRERRGLAGTGLGLAEHIAPGEQRRDRRGLDRRRRFIADLRQNGHHGVGKAQVAESDRVGIVLGRGGHALPASAGRQRAPGELPRRTARAHILTRIGRTTVRNTPPTRRISPIRHAGVATNRLRDRNAGAN